MRSAETRKGRCGVVLPGPARLPVEVLARLVQQEHIGELPDVVAPEAGWHPLVDDDALDEQQHTECARLGWLDRRGRLDAEVAQSLAVLCRASTEFSGWINKAGMGTVGVLVAATGRDAVLVVRQGDEVWLRRARSDQLAERLVSQLPVVRAGGGLPVSVPLTELRSASQWQEQRPGAVSVRPVPRAELREILRVMALPATGSGELWVAVRDSMGRRSEVAFPLRYADTEWGRYLNLATAGDNGEIWMVIAPASPGELVARLYGLHQSLT